MSWVEECYWEILCGCRHSIFGYAKEKQIVYRDSSGIVWIVQHFYRYVSKTETENKTEEERRAKKMFVRVSLTDSYSLRNFAMQLIVRLTHYAAFKDGFTSRPIKAQIPEPRCFYCITAVLWFRRGRVDLVAVDFPPHKAWIINSRFNISREIREANKNEKYRAGQAGDAIKTRRTKSRLISKSSFSAQPQLDKQLIVSNFFLIFIFLFLLFLFFVYSKRILSEGGRKWLIQSTERSHSKIGVFTEAQARQPQLAASSILRQVSEYYHSDDSSRLAENDSRLQLEILSSL